MANTYDYESNPQPGDMPYDQAEQAAEMSDAERADYIARYSAAQKRWDAFYANPSNGYC